MEKNLQSSQKKFVRKAGPAQPAAGHREHARTRVEAGDTRARPLTPAFHQKPSHALAENQDVSWRLDLIEECRSTTLQFVPSQDEFHPAIVRRERVEAHGETKRPSV